MRYKAGIALYKVKPFHSWCRCTTGPYYEDLKGVGERWARDPETGKGISVPSDMTYKEWKEIYVDKTSTMEEWQAKHTKTRKPLDKPAAGDNIGSSVHLFKQDSKDFPTIILPKDEYAHVMSEIATNLTEEQRKQPVFRKAIGNYYYSVENNGFGNYRIIRKESIE